VRNDEGDDDDKDDDDDDEDEDGPLGGSSQNGDGTALMQRSAILL
jgi:hypothetical protein